MKVTRRQVTGALLGAAALPERSQSQTTEPESPEQLLAAARDRLRRSSESLAKIDVPMSTEPAFCFKVL